MSANQPTAAWSGPGDPLLIVVGHLVSPQDNFGEIGRMPNGDLRRPGRIAVGLLGFHAPAAAPSVLGSLELGGNLSWTTDNANDISAIGANRARDFFLARNLEMGGDLIMSAAASRIIPGGTSFSVRNNADSADNLLVEDNGDVTVGDDFRALGKIRAAETIYMSERAAALGDEDGKGQLWVKTATPNELWFTDDAGTDFQVAFV